MFAYFIDDKFTPRGVFWVRGESSADILLRAPIAPEATRRFQAGTSLHIDKLTAIFESGPAESRRDPTGRDRRIVDLTPGSSRSSWRCRMACRINTIRFPTNYVYLVTISSSGGFVPMFETGAPDSRFLGVMVRLIPTYGDSQ